MSPDAGGVARAKRFRNHCENMFRGQKGWTPAGLAIIVKHRYKANEVAAMDLVGTERPRVCARGRYDGYVRDAPQGRGDAAGAIRGPSLCTPALHTAF